MNKRKEFEVVVPNPGSCGLGDVLMSIRSNGNRTDLVYVLPRHAAHLIPLFYDIAPVVIRDDVASELPPGKPLLRFSNAEMDEAKKVVEHFQKPIALVVNCAPHWAHVREKPADYWKPIVERIESQGRQVIQFGLSRNFTKVSSCCLLDLPIRNLAACYAAIGQYFGVDTGDRHLAEAVGSKASVLCPPDGQDYPHKLWHFESDLVKYYQWDEWEKLILEL